MPVHHTFTRDRDAGRRAARNIEYHKAADDEESHAMTIYGERNDEFRPRPKKLRVVLFSASFLLLAMQLAVLLTGVVHFLAIAGWSSEHPFPLYAPVAQKFQLPGVANVRSAAAESVAPAFALLSAAVVLYFWPTRLTLASRTASHLVSYSFVIVALAMSFEVPPTRWLAGDASELRFPVALLVALFLIQQIETRAVTLWANVVRMDTPGIRVLQWSVRLAIPLAILAGLAASNAYLPLAAAAAMAAAVTFLVNISSQPGPRFEALSQPEMREAAATAPFVALIVVGAAIVLFGMPRLGLRPRAIVIGGGEKLGLTSATGYQIQRTPSRKGHGSDGPAEDESVIDIRWSDKKPRQPPATTPTATTTSPTTSTAPN